MKVSIRLAVILLFACAGMIASPVRAQNYQCIQPDSTVWFTNNTGYLRGMRIDSVTTTGPNTIYHPYRSPRGPYMNNQQLDTNGGSWLGKRITKLPDGTHLVSNSVNDTVVIRSNSALNESWTFYSDTSAIFYTATVTAINWLPVLPGVYDSVKTISIQTRNASGPISSFRNSYLLRLSRNYGLIQAFDLWNFPYGYDAAFAGFNKDYFFLHTTPHDTALALFRRVNFVNRTYRDVFTWQPGDLFQYEKILGSNVADWMVEEVVSRNETPLTLHFVLNRTYHKRINTPQGWKFEVTGNQYTYYLPGPADSFIVRTDRLPEEWGSQDFYYYTPGSSGPACDTAGVYSNKFNFITPDARVITFEPCGDKSYTFRPGRGVTRYVQCHDPGGSPLNYELYMRYSKVNGVPCGQYIPVAVGGVEKETSMTVFPNPASHKITISLAGNRNAVVTQVIGADGRIVIQKEWHGTSTELDAFALPAGIYLLRHTIGKEHTRQTVQIIH